ncbi:MAG: HAMP domain-containing sensor histidine kinase [Alicyclobacillaceae bacterium]|nr:HAMP domain-containing sensor histidine kinase [Alicyclobacillaceae bacterium]
MRGILRPRRPGIEGYLRATRWRLTLSYTGILLVTTLVIGLFTGWSLRHQVVQDVEQVLRSHLPREEEREHVPYGQDHQEGPEREEPEHERFENRPAYEVGYFIVDQNRWYTPYPGGVLPYAAGAEEALRTRQPNLKLVTGPAAVPFYVYSEPTFRDGRPVLVRQASMEATLALDVLRHFDLLLYAFLILATLFALAGGYVLAGRALQPIARMAQRQQAFTSDASHQLRTPLTVIRTTAELALGSGNPEEWREALETTVSETHHMSQIVEALSDLARMDYEERPQQPLPFPVGDLLEEVTGHLEPIAAEKGVALHAPDRIEDILTGDRHRIRQLLLILLENAIKYTPAGGRVLLAYRRNNRQAVFTIRDTGIGIPPEDLPHVFERFYRGRQAQKEQIPGSGLGLAIAREIVRLHGGTIEIDSEPGTGTTVTVTLPATPYTNGGEAPGSGKN